MEVLLLSNDLMLIAALEHSARRVGGVLKSASDVDEAVQRCASSDVRLVIVDLSLPKLDLDGLITQTKHFTTPAPLILAFAPHVDEAALQRARAAGCDEVTSRGQLERTVQMVLQRLASA